MSFQATQPGGGSADGNPFQNTGHLISAVRVDNLLAGIGKLRNFLIFPFVGIAIGTNSFIMFQNRFTVAILDALNEIRGNFFTAVNHYRISGSHINQTRITGTERH